MAWDCSSAAAISPPGYGSGIGWSRLVAWLLVKRGDAKSLNEDGYGQGSFLQNIYIGLSTGSIPTSTVFSNSYNVNPYNKGWVKTPAGWKRDRTLVTPSDFGAASNGQPYGFVYLGMAEGIPAAPSAGILLGRIPTSQVVRFGQSGDMWSNVPLDVVDPDPVFFDISFLDVPGLVPAPVKANKAMRMYMLFCCWWYSRPCTWNQGVFVGDGTVSAAQGLTVNLRSGDLASLNPEVDQTDTVLATFTYGGSDFSVPDLYGRTYAQSTKTVSALASGTIGYVEILGATRADGLSTDHGRCKLYIPVSTIPAINCIATDKAATVSGQPISIYDFGLQFRLGS